NNITTYLTGLSIEMIPQNDSISYWVKIRWDDYDITEDARWTGKIVLKEQLNLKRNHSITFAQNRTPAQRYRDSQSGYFAEPTHFTCESGSTLFQEPQTEIVLTEKSSVVLDSGCHYTMGDSAILIVQSGSSFIVNDGAYFQVGRYSTIIIDSTAIVYIYDTAKLRSESQIHIRPGGKLVINGGTITNACEGEMWSGIFVDGHPDKRQQFQHQGSVILTNATIANAHNAINTRDTSNFAWEHSGGIIQASNTLFLNNKRTISFEQYENTNGNGEIISNVSCFTNCTFRIDSNNYFAENNGVFQNLITMWGVRDIRFNGCTFENTDPATTGSGRGRAIFSEDAGYTFPRICQYYVVNDPCGCEGNVVRCSFNGFYEAISCASSTGEKNITVDNCDFANCRTGMVVNAMNNIRFSHNNCNLNRAESGTWGLTLNAATGYTVEGNHFYKPTYNTKQAIGVLCNNTGIAENVIHKNTFQHLTLGSRTIGTNGISLPNFIPHGLQFTCNEFTDNLYDLYVNSNSNIRRVQGSASKGVDNDFNSTRSRSLTIPTSTDSITYYRSSATNHTPIGSGRYRLFSGTANNCASTLCGNSILIPGIIGYRNLSPIETYEMMSEEYDRLTQEFVDDGYDAVIQSVYEDGDAIYSEDIVNEALTAETQLSELSMAMAEYSNYHIKKIMEDTLMNYAALIDWYKHVNTLSAKYLLIETYYQTRQYREADQLLSELPDLYELSEQELAEFNNYSDFHALRNALIDHSVSNTARNWYQVTEEELSELQRIAEFGTDRASRMAQGVLCFFHQICYEDTADLLEEYNNEAAPQGRKLSAAVTGNNRITIYPNPAGSQLNVESSAPLQSVAIYDLSGKLLLEESVNANFATLNINHLQAGVYFLRAITDNGVERKCFVKR
ncbi:MAG: T9SS type A sorting domain-containing protein, partial [Bacteroidales bacterium]|nr:T9SS type A sorting domain-containing protein [Bacteroidales bacterium]